jgi:putative chitinase
MAIITINLLREIAPKTKVSTLNTYVEPLNIVGNHFNLFQNPRRIAAFLAQVAHESGGFNFIRENLNYNAQALMRTWPRRFPTLQVAQQFARNPQKIANTVYANRMGNGSVESGDGWRFIGRGLIQLTGRDNYTRFANSINRTLDQTVAYLETPQGATASAGWFWDTNKLNIYADKNDFIGLTRRINGGTIGLKDRMHHYDLALKALS